jgi:phasin family protein
MSVRQGKEDGRETGRKAMQEMGAEAGRSARAATAAVEDAARAGDRALRDSLERGRQAMNEGTAAAERVTQGVGDRIGQSVDAMGTGMRQAMQMWDAGAVMRSGSILAGGMQTISREWMHLAGERLERNVARMEGLMRCRTPQELMAAQYELLNDNLAALLTSSRRIAEMSVQVAEDAAQAVREPLQKRSSPA